MRSSVWMWIGRCICIRSTWSHRFWPKSWSYTHTPTRKLATARGWTTLRVTSSSRAKMRKTATDCSSTSWKNGLKNCSPTSSKCSKSRCTNLSGCWPFTTPRSHSTSNASQSSPSATSYRGSSPCSPPATSTQWKVTSLICSGKDL